MYDAVCMRWHYNGRNYIFTKKGFPVKLRGLPMNERVKKYLSVMLAYGIPVMLIMKTVPFMSGYLKGLDACVADYFLFFFDWRSNGFICMYEIVLFSFFMVTIIKTELLPNRIVLYNSRIKLFCSCVKTVSYTHLDVYKRQDLCTVIGNLIDNAIEAELRENEYREIEISSFWNGEECVFRIGNFVSKSVLDNNEELQTVKADKVSHGLGTQIIRNLMKKNKGICDYYEEGEMFYCTIRW